MPVTTLSDLSDMYQTATKNLVNWSGEGLHCGTCLALTIRCHCLCCIPMLPSIAGASWRYWNCNGSNQEGGDMASLPHQISCRYCLSLLLLTAVPILLPCHPIYALALDAAVYFLTFSDASVHPLPGWYRNALSRASFFVCLLLSLLSS